MRRRHRLPDHGSPRERTRDDRDEVEPDRERHPLPAHLRERIADRGEAGTAPPEEEADDAHRRQRADDPQHSRMRQRGPPNSHAGTGAASAHTANEREPVTGSTPETAPAGYWLLLSPPGTSAGGGGTGG